MDRDLILRCSRTIRLEHKVPMEFTQVINEYCIQKGHPEHFNACVQLTQHSMISGEIIHRILEYFEKEFHIIKLEKLPDAYSINQKQLINIY